MQLPAPAEVKRWILAEIVRRNPHVRTFVETGTFHGDTVAAVLPLVDQAWSFEVDEELSRRARERFLYEKRVHLVHGDTAQMLPAHLYQIPAPALFWLDAHWMGEARRDPTFGFEVGGPAMTRGKSGDTPIEDELTAILDRGCPFDIIVIDDARYFGSDPSYPRVRDLVDLVRNDSTSRTIDLALDMIFIGPFPSFIAPTAGVSLYGDQWGVKFVKENK